MDDFADSTAVALDVEHANLYAVCELVAGRAARASGARQYRAIYTRFCDALRDELGRPPVVANVTADAIAGYSREQERGGPASPATRRVHLTMLRALLWQLGLRRMRPRYACPPIASGRRRR